MATYRQSLDDIVQAVRDLLGEEISKTLENSAVQAALDRSRLRHERTLLASVYEQDSSGVRTFLSWTCPSYLDTDASLEDSAFAAVTSPVGDSFDRINGRITFAAARGNSNLYLVGWEYDIYRAAAEILRQSAVSMVARPASFTASVGSVNRGESPSKRLEGLAAYYETQSKRAAAKDTFKVVRMTRAPRRV